MSNYTPVTSFGPKDALATGTPSKLIKGTEFDAEFQSISASIQSKLEFENIATTSQAAGLISDTTLISPSKLGYALQNATVNLSATFTWGGVALADVARLSQANVFSQATAGQADHLFRNTSNSSAALVSVRVRNDASRSLVMLYTSSTRATALLTGGPTTEGGHLYTEGAQSLSLGTNAAERVRIAGDGSLINLKATSVQVNGINVLVDSGTFANARIAASNVTQHQAALSIATSQLTGTLADARVAQSNVTQHAAAVLATANVTSGTYTPVATAIANVDAIVTAVCQWMRVGNVATVSGTIAVDTTAAGPTATSFRMTLPVASDFTTGGNLGGVGAIMTSLLAGSSVVRITADSTNDAALFEWSAASTISNLMSFQFSYIIQ